MSKIVSFLENVGQDSELRFMKQGELESAMAASAIDQETREAIVSGDPAEVERVLGTNSIICCAILNPEPGKEDDEEEEEPKEDEIHLRTLHQVA
jgi:hypothetical protein